MTTAAVTQLQMQQSGSNRQSGRQAERERESDRWAAVETDRLHGWLPDKQPYRPTDRRISWTTVMQTSD